MAKEINGKIPTIGFIGIGPMGGKMARWLLKDGYPLLVYDIDAQKLAAAQREGALIAVDNKDVVMRSDIIMTSLPLSEIWAETAEKELIPNAKIGQIFIDVGTATPCETRRLYHAFKERGASLIDAPVSNSGPGPDDKLYMFIAGDKEVAVSCWSIFEILGVPEHIVYCGQTGNGQIVKGVNQLGIGLINAAFIEILAFAVRSGVEPEAMIQAVGLEGNSGFRGMLYSIGQDVINGKAEGVVVKHGQLQHYIKEAGEKGFSLPLTEALYKFLEKSPMVIPDANRRSPSFWKEMMTREL